MSWRSGPELPRPLYQSATTLYSNSLLVTGGYTLLSDDEQDAILMYDPDNEQWHEMAFALDKPRSGHVAIIVDFC